MKVCVAITVICVVDTDNFNDEVPQEATPQDKVEHMKDYIGSEYLDFIHSETTQGHVSVSVIELGD